MGSPDKRIEFLVQSLREDPDNLQHHSELGDLLQDIGKFPEAMAHTRRFLAGVFGSHIQQHAQEGGTALATRIFHEKYYYSLVWANTFWMGIPVLKCPMDLWVYQEILHEQRPDLVIETGTYNGGSALFFASMFDLIGAGEVVTIDVTAKGRLPQHSRIHYVVGSSLDEAVLSQVAALATGKTRIMVVLDSLHKKDHVSQELQSYAKFVSPKSYLVVEDTNIGGHPVWPRHGPGPREAVAEFMTDNDDFEIDRSREKFLMSFNTFGFLKRKAP